MADWQIDDNEFENGDGQFVLFDGNLTIVLASLETLDFSLDFPC